MATDSGFIDYLRELLEPLDGVTFKRMFGSYGVFRHGLMFALISADTLYFKADEQNKAEFTARDLEPFTYMKADKPMPLAYYRAPEETLDNSDDMCEWAEKAYQAALRAQKLKKPVKARRKRKAQI